MPVRKGVTSNLYINEGTYEAPTWTAIDLIRDANIAGQWDKGEAFSRRTRMKQYDTTLLEQGITGNIRSDADDSGYQALRDSWIGDTVIDIMALNGAEDENGVEGVRFDAKVFNLSEDQSIGNILYKEFDISPCVSENVPKYVIIEGGVPVFYDIGEVPS